MTARDYLAAVQQRADAATDGPWAVVKGAFDVEVYGNEGKQYVAHTGDRGFVNAHLDAEFIAPRARTSRAWSQHSPPHSTSWTGSTPSTTRWRTGRPSSATSAPRSRTH
jgi:hypothetical protein